MTEAETSHPDPSPSTSAVSQELETEDTPPPVQTDSKPQENRTRTMDGSVFNISREIVEEFISPQMSQAISHHYGQLIDSELENTGAIPQNQNTPLDPEQVDFQTAEQEGFEQEINPEQAEHVVGKGKRRRPKYSLTGAMLKKHPVLRFSATGPLDKKSPYKWWCRVCEVEL